MGVWERKTGGTRREGREKHVCLTGNCDCVGMGVLERQEGGGKRRQRWEESKLCVWGWNVLLMFGYVGVGEGESVTERSETEVGEGWGKKRVGEKMSVFGKSPWKWWVGMGELERQWREEKRGDRREGERQQNVYGVGMSSGNCWVHMVEIEGQLREEKRGEGKGCGCG